jgi:hypothetical protein
MPAALRGYKLSHIASHTDGIGGFFICPIQNDHRTLPSPYSASPMANSVQAPRRASILTARQATITATRM